MTHAKMSAEDKQKAGITDDLVRYAVGIEDSAICRRILSRLWPRYSSLFNFLEMLFYLIDVGIEQKITVSLTSKGLNPRYISTVPARKSCDTIR